MNRTRDKTTILGQANRIEVLDAFALAEPLWVCLSATIVMAIGWSRGDREAAEDPNARADRNH